MQKQVGSHDALWQLNQQSQGVPGALHFLFGLRLALATTVITWIAPGLFPCLLCKGEIQTRRFLRSRFVAVHSQPGWLDLM